MPHRRGKSRLLSKHSEDVLAGRAPSYVDRGPKPTNPIPDFNYPPIGMGNQPARPGDTGLVPLPPIGLPPGQLPPPQRQPNFFDRFMKGLFPFSQDVLIPGTTNNQSGNTQAESDMEPFVNPPGAIRRLLTPPGEKIPSWARLPGGPEIGPKVEPPVIPPSKTSNGDTFPKPTTRAGFSDQEFDSFQQQIEDSVASGTGTFPRGALRYTTIEKDGVTMRVLTPESERLWNYWRELVGDAEARRAEEQEQRQSQQRWEQQQQQFGVTNALEQAKLHQIQQQQQQTFLTSLLTNPAAMAAFQLQSVMSGGRGQFQGGGMGFPQDQLPEAAGKFGFSPYQTPPQSRQIVGAPTGSLADQQRIYQEDLDTQRNYQPFQPIGAPVSNFFQSGVPTLGGLGGSQTQDLQALLGMLALFGINPEQFQQQSAMVTPRSVSTGGGRVALATGRR